MTGERWQEIRTVLEAALPMDSEQRRAYLDQACGSDQSLRREVKSLLAADKQAQTGFLESPPLARKLEKGTRLGDYEIQSLLGAGGMGEVYRARDLRLRREVAVKVLPAVVSSDPERLRRFEQEATAAAALNHPNILAVYLMGTYDGEPYLVSELLEGQPLSERVSGKPVPVPELVDLAMQTCDALQAAHARGIVHRDIKPANIFLTTNGQIKILDFGLAKLVEESHSAATTITVTEAEIIASAITRTRIGRLVGTPAYLSPEQARGEEVDARTDIFSFGLVLYEMATGSPAFRGQTSGELINAILHETPAKPSALNPTIPGNLERIILKALEKERKTRYQSCEELVTDLSEFQTAKQRRAAWRVRLVLAAAALALTTAIVLAIILSNGSVNDAPNIVQQQVTSNPINDSVYVAAISNDGKEVAYTDLRGVHVRALGTGEVYDVSVPPGLCFR